MSESVRTRDMGDHVDIQVGSRIYLSVFKLKHCIALRWRVTHLG